MIIIDEMPIFFDECIFDIGAENNSVTWFDNLTANTGLSVRQKAFGRACIMLMITKQFLDEEATVTSALINYLGDDGDRERFESMYGHLTEQKQRVDWETQRYKRWFDRLLREDAVGAIDRDNFKGDSILCSKRIDYRGLGNILILDGTSNQTPTIYNGEYLPVHVDNRHDYKGRLHLHWKILNTSFGARKDSGGVYETIARDMVAIRKSGLNPFPLVAKRDIKTYLANGVILEEQVSLYDIKVDPDRSLERVQKKLALNIFNTTGKNDLRDYSALALTNLPVRNPQYYKLKAIGLYGTSIDLSMADKNETGWFNDPYLEFLFVELSLAELLQIIHRTNLRDIERETRVDLFMYHHRKQWTELLQNVLDLDPKKVVSQELINESKHGFEDKCRQYADQCVRFFADNGREHPFIDETYTANHIGGRKFKEWLNRGWKDGRRESVVRIFAEYGIQITETRRNRGEKRIGLMTNYEKSK